MLEPRVRLVVLNFNGGDDTLRCLAHLDALDWPAAQLEIVVVDNASTDGSPEKIAEQFPQVEVRRNHRNGGFPANNLALGDLEGIDFVGLINNDAFVEPRYLRPLVEALQDDPTIGAAIPKIVLAETFVPVTLRAQIGARLVAPPQAIPGQGWNVPDSMVDRRPIALATTVALLVPTDQVSDIKLSAGPTAVLSTSPPVSVINNIGNELTTAWFGADHGLHQIDTGQFDEPADVFAWCGAGVLFSKDYLAAIGLFDERLFLYYEDLELAWRGREQGWRHRTVPTAVLRHRHGASTTIDSPMFRYYVERNRLVTLTMHAPVSVVCSALLRYLLVTASYFRRDVMKAVLRRTRPSMSIVGVRLRSLVGFFRLGPHALLCRRRHRQAAGLAGLRWPIDPRDLEGAGNRRQSSDYDD